MTVNSKMCFAYRYRTCAAHNFFFKGFYHTFFPEKCIPNVNVLESILGHNIDFLEIAIILENHFIII